MAAGENADVTNLRYHKNAEAVKKHDPAAAAGTLTARAVNGVALRTRTAVKLSSLQARYGPSGSLWRAGTRRRVQPRHKAEGFSRQRVFSTLTMMRVGWRRGSEADRAQFFIVVHWIKNYISVSRSPQVYCRSKRVQVYCRSKS